MCGFTKVFSYKMFQVFIVFKTASNIVLIVQKKLNNNKSFKFLDFKS